MNKLILVRGLPGSGKSTFATGNVDGDGWTRIYAADDFFYDEDGVYDFKPSMLREAHAECLKSVTKEVNSGPNWKQRNTTYKVDRTVAVHNTFSQRWELEPYLSLVRENKDWQVVVVDLYDGGLEDVELYQRNVHDVPLEKIQEMRRRWEHDWKNGNPIPPWDRKGE